MLEKKYRPELDGIRAIAVLAVIFYHAELSVAGFNFLPGGFLGVDIFFVLSGFLITGILLGKNISLLRFYKSRVDRIFPALVLVLLLSCVYAFLFLLPKDVLVFSESINSALGFFSNFFFMQEDAYVAEASKLKPLLHTWSLGVEWQFYLIFPLVILAVKNKIKPDFVISVLLFASFAYCIYLLGIDKNQAFYHSLSRFWEILVGGMVYLLSLRVQKTSSKGWLAWLGMLLIGLGLVLVHDSDSHPGWISWLATGGVALVILYVAEGSVLYRLLASRWMVFVGVLSYAMYLVHQPVFAFYRLSQGDLDWLSFAALFAVIIAMAYAIWRWYEGPLRYAQGQKKYVLLLAMAALVLAFGWFAKERDGFVRSKPADVPEAFLNPSVIDFRRLTSEREGKTFSGGSNTQACLNRTPETACVFGDAVRVVNVGDSFAATLDYALREHVQEQGLMVQTYQQCPLLADPIWFGTAPECWEINKKRWDVFKNLAPSVVIMSSNYEQFTRGKQSVDAYVSGQKQSDTAVNEEMVWQSFYGTIARLVEMGHHPIVVNQPPKPDYEIEQRIKRRMFEGTWDGNPVWSAKPDKKFNARIAQIVSQHPKAQLFNIHSQLCKEDKGCLLFNSEGAMFEVGNHLSGRAVNMVMPQLIPVINESIGNLN